MKTVHSFLVRGLFNLCIIAMIAAGSSSEGRAQENPKLQGKGEVVCKKSRAIPAEIDAATRKAKMDVLARYVASSDQARQANLARIRAALESSIDTHLVGMNVLVSSIDKKSRVYTIVIEAQVNLGSIEQEIRRHLGSAPAATAASGEKQPIAFVFVSRRETAVTEKGPKMATRQTSFQEARDQENQRASANEISVASISKSEVTTISESSITRSADTVAYDVAASEGIDSAMSAVFTTGGFDTVPASELYSATNGAFDLKRFIQDYRTGDDISQETRKMVTDSCRKVEVPFVAFGTLTMQLKDKDPVTGQTTVGVIVNGQVWDLRKKLSIKAASIGPVQYQALGKSQTEAEQQALKEAGQKAAGALVDQLRARGIQ
ncbi:MAG TPA: hypothetical protein P5186_03880 [Candidatus Paceibacterota bacterium]|nr:hypothetical protein [Verrucomicrobiota bacterium]HRY47167.1 hypothetical protein [Candidatus Paceibacterota bacterium]HRZ99704.1 hypothetical protein [Candidatus Paceibacterota bacterium]